MPRTSIQLTPHVAVKRGISNERKLPVPQAPGERRAAGEKQGQKPYPVALPIEYARKQCPKQNVGHDVQIRTEEMRFYTSPLKKCPVEADQQAIHNSILAIRRVLMGRPVRDRQPEPSGK